MPLTHTVVSYPDRGPWGDNRYRGNCSGYLIKDLIESFMPTSILDPMEGSGTTGHVAADFGIPYLGYDLRKGHNILDRRVQGQIFSDAMKLTGGKGIDMVFFHPPYWNMIQYNAGDPADFCNGPYSTWISRMEGAFSFLQKTLSPTGFIALLLADLRRRQSDRTYFLSDDCTRPEIMGKAKLIKEIRIIKIQHKTVSNGVTSHSIRFAHEYLTILRNARALDIADFSTPVAADTDLDLEGGEDSEGSGGS